MHKVLDKLWEEFLKVLPPTIFFFITLHLIAIVRVLIAKGTGFQPLTTASILISSLVLGKVVLIADMLPLINRYPDKPLIYNVAWKTVIYLLISLILHYLEHLFDYWRGTGRALAANRELAARLEWAPFLSVRGWLVVMVS